MCISVLVFCCVGATLLNNYHKKYTLIHLRMTYKKDISQVDLAPNNHPDKAGNNLTPRIKDDLHTANTVPSINDEKKKKRRRDPNKHYISGMFSFLPSLHSHTLEILFFCIHFEQMFLKPSCSHHYPHSHSIYNYYYHHYQFHSYPCEYIARAKPFVCSFVY